MMKHLILSFSDSNMAGFRWRWEFYVQRYAKAWRVSARQIVEEESPMVIEPRPGCTDGADIYEALRAMVEEAGYSLDPDDLQDIGKILAELDPKVADEFCRGEAIIERREAAAAKRALEERERRLAPFRERIEKYVLRFSDSEFRFGGRSKRALARSFIENFVAEHGSLPTGVHVIRVQAYAGEQHDFGDFSRVANHFGM